MEVLGSIDFRDRHHKNTNMKTKKLLGIFFLFLCTITLVSCGDDEKQEIYSLSFEKGYYERPLLGAKNIPVRGGNRDYTVTVQNTDVLSIDIDLSSPIDMGNLVVKPKQKGETTITVKDNVTNETVDLKIKIVNSYLNLKVAHPAQVPYTGGENLFFINNSSTFLYSSVWCPYLIPSNLERLLDTSELITTL